MKLELDSNGLPGSGRPLDAWVCEHVLHYVWITHPNVEERYLVSADAAKAFAIAGWVEAVSDEPIPDDYFTKWAGIDSEVSTTAAFFQVMGADPRWLWDFEEQGTALLVTRWDSQAVLEEFFAHGGVRLVEGATQLIVHRPDYPDREHAYAHAVCACVWKAKGGVSDAGQRD